MGYLLVIVAVIERGTHRIFIVSGVIVLTVERLTLINELDSVLFPLTVKVNRCLSQTIVEVLYLSHGKYLLFKIA
jgi:hypothetical protein